MLARVFLSRRRSNVFHRTGSSTANINPCTVGAWRAACYRLYEPESRSSSCFRELVMNYDTDLATRLISELEISDNPQSLMASQLLRELTLAVEQLTLL